MKRFVVWGSILLGLAIVAGCLQAHKGSPSSATGVIYRHHFVGTEKIAAGTNATKLKEILALDQTKAVREQVLKKLAALPVSRWPKKSPANSAELLRPLLEDLAAHESYVQVSGSLSRPEWTVAVAIPEQRDKLWSKNVRALLERSGLKLQVARAGQWTLVGFGRDEPKHISELAQKAQGGGRAVPALANDAILELQGDAPRLATVLPVLAPYHFPPAEFTVSGRGENLRTEGKIRPAQKFSWNFQPWKIPTNRIPESIVSFTVAQGIAPVLKNFQPITELGLKTYPNQFCAWGLDTLQAHTSVAMPVKDATNMILQVSRTLPKVVQKYLRPQLGNFIWVSNRAELLWADLPPFVAPFLRAVEEQGQEYVFFSMFPFGLVTNKPPQELLAQLEGRKDLAYYDWEITGPRVAHGKQYFQLQNLFARRLLPPEKGAPQQWLIAITPRLGNTITEITVTNEEELDFARKSHIGFTGLELAIIALWFDSPSFPFDIDPRPPVPKPPPAVITNAPPGNTTKAPPGTGANAPARPK